MIYIGPSGIENKQKKMTSKACTLLILIKMKISHYKYINGMKKNDTNPTLIYTKI